LNAMSYVLLVIIDSCNLPKNFIEALDSVYFVTVFCLCGRYDK